MASKLDRRIQKKNRNFIKENWYDVVYRKNTKAREWKMAVVQKEERRARLDINKNFAKLPAYIHRYRREDGERHQRWLEREEEAKIPAGLRLVNEEERFKTLHDLKDARKEI